MPNVSSSARDRAALQKVVLVLARTRVMRRAATRAATSLRRRRVVVDKARLVDVMPWWTFFTCYVAFVHLLVDTWDESLLHDESVYLLLKDGYRKELRRNRNAVFHTEAWSDPRLAALREEKFRVWIEQVVLAIQAYCQRAIQRLAMGR